MPIYRSERKKMTENIQINLHSFKVKKTFRKKSKVFQKYLNKFNVIQRTEICYNVKMIEFRYIKLSPVKRAN